MGLSIGLGNGYPWGMAEPAISPLLQKLIALGWTPGAATGASTNAGPSAPAKLASDDLLDAFLAYVSEQKLELYPAQEEAILELYSGKNLILNTPTGSGKSLVATALHFKSLAEKRRSVYTSPIKALVNEKFLSLCREFGPDQVGMVTGDATVNPQARIICCTAEILAIDALRWGRQAPVDDVIMDEFHYYSDRERGVAWQVPLLALPQTRFLLMSATLGDTAFFEKELTALNGLETALVHSSHRPVPLDFRYSEDSLQETATRLITQDRAPVYIVNFTQRDCAETAQDFLSVDFCSKDEKKAIAEALYGVEFSSPYGKEMQKLLKHGIGLHHAGILPKYRLVVEKLAQRGMLKLICGTDTLGVGVNIPIRTVLFTKLCKFDGEKTGLLTVRDFKQISGRAGRKGYDNEGTVVAQAPEHVIENLKAERKAAGDPKKTKKLVKKKPPEKGYVNWNEETFRKLIEGQPEALTSRFQINHGMLLYVLARDEDGCEALRDLIRRSHESDHAKRRLRRSAFELFRSLVQRKIIEILPQREANGRKLRINVDLQQDFSLNHTLSLYLIDTIHLLDRADPAYPLDLMTLVESILENPDQVLRKQLDHLKGVRVAELKAEGMDFDQRMEELEKLEYPKPNRDFIYDTFNEFAAAHPWIGQENIRPKSIAREMYEKYMSFGEYIREYELQRVEGILLRYLSNAYKVLAQNVPTSAKTEAVDEMEVYLGALVRRIDSSLVDEWEKMRNPDWIKAPELKTAADERREQLEKLRQERKELTLRVRNHALAIVRALSIGDYAEVESLMPGVTVPELERAGTEYATDHSRILIDAQARSPQNTRISWPENTGGELTDSGPVPVEQVLMDPEGHNDWSIKLELDLGATRASGGQPALRFVSLGSL